MRIYSTGSHLEFYFLLIVTKHDMIHDPSKKEVVGVK